MYTNKKSSTLLLYFIGFLMLFSLCAFFIRPKATFEGVFIGLENCYKRIIPSLFPFFIISSIIMVTPLAKYAGISLYPYTRLLGIKSKKAPLAMALGILGGFAGASLLINNLYDENEISESEASLLLCSSVTSGPAFVINAVGYSMFGSSVTGAYFMFSLVFANLITGFIVHFFLKPFPPILTVNDKQKPMNITDIFQNAIYSILSLCGYVTAFSFFSKILLPQNASSFSKYILSSFLEVTAGCYEASHLGKYKVYFACASLSILGICAFMQMKSICSVEISLKPFLLSRFIHLPVSLTILWLMIKIFPYSIQSAATPYKSYFRLPADTCLVLFLVTMALFFDFSPLKHLRKSKYKV